MSDMAVDLSIIVPIYNVSAYLEECLQSIINQSCSERIECILVDDCGTDDSMALAERFVAGYDGQVRFSIVHHEHNKGLSGARNTGYSYAQGKYVMFLDSDDLLTVNCVSSMMAPVRHREYDMVIGEFCVIEGPDVFMHISLPKGECLGRDLIAVARSKHRWYPMAWGKIYRKSFLESYGLAFFEGILHEDELFSSQLACVASSLYCTDDVVYKYRVREQSIMTSSAFSRKLQSCKSILDQMYRFMIDNGFGKNPVCNDLLYNLFSFANQMALKSSEADYKKYYPEFRALVNRRFGERFFANNRLRAFVRDAHFLMPKAIGRALYKYASL